MTCPGTIWTRLRPPRASAVSEPSGCSIRTTEDCTRKSGKTLSTVRSTTSETSSDSVSVRASRASSSASARRWADSAYRRALASASAA